MFGKLKEGDLLNVILERFKANIKALYKTKGDYNESGEYIEGTTEEINFRGAILPLSEDDFVRNPDAGYTRHDRKLYTAQELKNGQTVVWDNANWTIEGDLDYSYINKIFKRYYMVRRGDISD